MCLCVALNIVVYEEIGCRANQVEITSTIKNIVGKENKTKVCMYPTSGRVQWRLSINKTLIKWQPRQQFMYYYCNTITILLHRYCTKLNALSLCLSFSLYSSVIFPLVVNWTPIIPFIPTHIIRRIVNGQY